mmetsp:Transcript_54690/g.113012  ORF Transcript_54690/g.113012 Transcript_54690/m.113012 type:complete len:291 (-) Transcript_54690:319-1191(-)
MYRPQSYRASASLSCMLSQGRGSRTLELREQPPSPIQEATIPRHRASHLLNLLQLTIEAILVGLHALHPWASRQRSFESGFVDIRCKAASHIVCRRVQHPRCQCHPGFGTRHVDEGSPARSILMRLPEICCDAPRPDGAPGLRRYFQGCLVKFCADAFQDKPVGLIPVSEQFMQHLDAQDCNVEAHHVHLLPRRYAAQSSHGLAQLLLNLVDEVHLLKVRHGLAQRLLQIDYEAILEDPTARIPLHFHSCIVLLPQQLEPVAVQHLLGQFVLTQASLDTTEGIGIAQALS